jgi:hypothetical protein
MSSPLGFCVATVAAVTAAYVATPSGDTRCRTPAAARGLCWNWCGARVPGLASCCRLRGTVGSGRFCGLPLRRPLGGYGSLGAASHRGHQRRESKSPLLDCHPQCVDEDRTQLQRRKGLKKGQVLSTEHRAGTSPRDPSLAVVNRIRQS